MNDHSLLAHGHIHSLRTPAISSNIGCLISSSWGHWLMFSIDIYSQWMMRFNMLDKSWQCPVKPCIGDIFFVSEGRPARLTSWIIWQRSSQSTSTLPRICDPVWATGNGPRGRCKISTNYGGNKNVYDGRSILINHLQPQIAYDVASTTRRVYQSFVLSTVLPQWMFFKKTYVWVRVLIETTSIGVYHCD